MTVKALEEGKYLISVRCPECDHQTRVSIGRKESKIIKCNWCGIKLKLTHPYWQIKDRDY